MGVKNQLALFFFQRQLCSHSPNWIHGASGFSRVCLDGLCKATGNPRSELGPNGKLERTGRLFEIPLLSHDGLFWLCVCVCVCVCVYSHAFSLETFQMDSELLSSCKAMSTSGTLLIFYLCYLIYCFRLPPWCSGKESNFKSCKTMGQRQALK